METFAIFAEILESLKQRHIRVVLMDEAAAFIRALPEKQKIDKITNILRRLRDQGKIKNLSKGSMSDWHIV